VISALLNLLALLLPSAALVSGLIAAPVACAMGLLLLATSQKDTVRDCARDTALLPWVLFAIWAMLSLFWTPDVADAGEGVLGLLIVAAAGFWSVRTRGSSTLAVPLMIGMNLALVWAAVETYFGGVMLPVILESLGSSGDFMLYTMNRGATFLALALWPLMAIWIRRGDGFIAVAQAILLVTVLSGLDSLSALTGIAAGVGALITVLLLGRYGVWAVLIGTIFIMLTLPVWTMRYQTPDIDGLQESHALPETAIHRLYIWQFASEKAKEKPLIGWGFRAARVMPGGHDEAAPGKALLPLHPHNQLLEIWLELGAVGVVLFLWGVWSLFLRSVVVPAPPEGAEGKARPLMDVSNAVDAALMAAFLTSFFAISMTAYSTWQPWWLATALITGAWLRWILMTPEETPAPDVETAPR
jgi:exopolysaccharide production protein ExoQ